MTHKTKIKTSVVAAFALAATVGIATALVAFPTAETASATSVPDEKRTCLSDDAESAFYVTTMTSAAATVRFIPETSYTLENVTDIAMRLEGSTRQRSTTNKKNGLTYVNFKFKNDDTVWNLQNGTSGTAVGTFTTYSPDGTTGTVSCMGTGATGGQMTYAKGSDATVYIPLSMIYAGNDTETSLAATEGYGAYQLEYIEFAISTYRWDLKVGEMALVKNDGESYQTMELTPEAQSNGAKFALITEEKTEGVWSVDTVEKVALELPEHTSEKTFVGWQKTGAKDLYKAGASVTVAASSSVVYNAVSIDFSTKNAAYFKIGESEAYSGIRFDTAFDTAEYETIADSVVSFGTLILPISSLEDGEKEFTLDTFTAGETVLKIASTSQTAEGSCTLYKGAITKLYEKNYAVDFVARGYMEISYADGTSGYIYGSYENVGYSVQWLAYQFKTNDTDEYNALTESQRNIIDAYIGDYNGEEDA